VKGAGGQLLTLRESEVMFEVLKASGRARGKVG
jgi:hypothetical protein